MSDRAGDRPRRLRRLSIGPKLVLRQLRSDATVVVALIGVVFISALVLAAMPRWFAEMSTDGLAASLRDAPASARNLSVTRTSRIAPGSEDVFRNVADAGDRFRDDELPASLLGIVAAHTFVIESPSFTMAPLAGDPPWPHSAAAMRLRFQQSVDDHVRLVDGRWPAPRDPMPVLLEEDAPEELVPVFEIALGSRTLAELRLAIGDRLLMQPARSDRLYRSVPAALLDYYLVFEVAGAFEPGDESAEYWFEDPLLYSPRVFENPDFAVINAAGLIAPADYRRWLDETGSAEWRYTWRYLVDPDRVDAAGAEELAADVRNLEVTFRPSGVTRAGQNSVATGLSLILEQFFDQRRSTIALLSLVTIGLGAVAFAVIVLLGALVTDRQATALHLIRSRGAGRFQLVMSRAAAGLLIGGPAAWLGLFAAGALVPGPASPLARRAAIVVAIATMILLVAVALPLINRNLEERPHARRFVRVSIRRRVVEVAVVIVAVAAVVLLRRRGVAADAADGAFDPMVAAAPTLLAVAVGIVTLRLFDYPVRLVARWTRRADVVGFVGVRRILQQAAAVRLPLLVILLAVAIAAFAGSVRLSVERGQRDSTWQEVGADFRLAVTNETIPLPAALDLTAVDSIEATAFGIRLAAEPVTPLATAGPLDLLGMDLAAYETVVAGTPAAVTLAATLTVPPSAAPAGTEADPVPVVVAARLANDSALTVGDRLVLDLGRGDAVFVIAATRDRFPGLPLQSPFVVADLAGITAIDGVAARPTVAYVRAPAAALADLDAARNAVLGVRLTSRAALYEQTHGAPLAAGVGRGFRLAFWVGTGFAMVAVVVAVLLTSPDRRRDLAYLRTLGLSRRQARRVAIVEQLPPALMVAAVGAALGGAITFLVEPGIDLAAFSGSAAFAALRIDVGGIVMVVGAVLLAAVATVLASSYLTRDDDLGSILRLGDE